MLLETDEMNRLVDEFREKILEKLNAAAELNSSFMNQRKVCVIRFCAHCTVFKVSDL